MTQGAPKMQGVIGRRLVVEHARQTPQDLPRGVIVLHDAPLALQPVAGGSPIRLPADAQITPVDPRRDPRRWLVRATGWNLQLLDAGEATADDACWASIARAFDGRVAVFTRIPSSQAIWCRLETLTPLATGVLLSLRDLSHRLQTVPITTRQVAAIYWDAQTLEVRAATGQGFGLQLHCCTRCAAPIDDPAEYHVVDQASYCSTCVEALTAEQHRANRRRAQLLVGACRGCAFYGWDFEGRSFGFSGQGAGICTQPARLAALGSLTGRVDDCAFRQPRSADVERPRRGTTGRLTTEARRSRRPTV